MRPHRLGGRGNERLRDLVTDTSVNGDNLAYAQYQEADIPNYWAYAKAFTLGDHFFANVLGRAFPGT